MGMQTPLQNQLLVTKFFIPVVSYSLISRPRLSALLDESLKYPLTLVSAPAGFGKTTLLATWAQSLLAKNSQVAWVSLDEEDNELWLFWVYVLTALNRQQPERFTPLLLQLQSPQSPPLKYLLTSLINELVEGTEHFLLILDDYQAITDQQIHSSLSYLVEHLPTQLHIILSTRAEPPLPLAQFRARQQVLEIYTDQLRCTVEETRAFLKEITNVELPEAVAQQVTDRMEGWLVGLQLLGLSLQEQADPAMLLHEISGDQRYILDYLTEGVLRQQPQEVQIFLLSTCILEQLTASLCDAVMQQAGSQQMLHWLEQANLFVVPLDSKREGYRYHALFAEALRYQLEHMHTDLVPILHHRASLWYAEHDQTTPAILHALHAKEWQRVADLIESKSLPLLTLSWGASQHTLVRLRQWLEQLPVDIVGSRPGLCLSSSLMLWTVAPHTLMESWLDVAEARLTASLQTQPDENVSSTIPASPTQQDLLGVVISIRALLRSYQEDGQAALSLCEQALALLSPDNIIAHAGIAHTQHVIYGISSANDGMASIDTAWQAVLLAQKTGLPALAIGFMGSAAQATLTAGQLHETYRLTQEAIQLGTKPGDVVLPEIGYPALYQAEVLREWNRLDAALSRVEEAIEFCQKSASTASLAYLMYAYVILVRVHLSRREFDAARSALQQFEWIGMRMNYHLYTHVRSDIIVYQVRHWLLSGELDRATQWAQELDISERHGTPYAREREEVAYARILLAKQQPTLALQRLEPVLQRATIGQRWGQVIEIRLLQALAHQMCEQEAQAVDTLSEAIRLAKPENYIRCFVDEGAPMEALLYSLRKRDRKRGPTPYLDTLIAAFQREREAQAPTEESTKTQMLPKPLSERELQILQLLAQGVSNQEIAQELVITIDTVKRHVRHILSKLGVQDRFHAVKQAQELGLLSEET